MNNKNTDKDDKNKILDTIERIGQRIKEKEAEKKKAIKGEQTNLKLDENSDNIRYKKPTIKRAKKIKSPIKESGQLDLEVTLTGAEILKDIKSKINESINKSKEESAIKAQKEKDDSLQKRKDRMSNRSSLIRK